MVSPTQAVVSGMAACGHPLGPSEDGLEAYQGYHLRIFMDSPAGTVERGELRAQSTAATPSSVLQSTGLLPAR